MTKTKTKTKKNINKVSKDSIKTLKEKIRTLQSDIKKGSDETTRITEKSIRLLAEFDNYKRRTQEERIDLLKYGGEELAKALLPISDDLRSSSTEFLAANRSKFSAKIIVLSSVALTFCSKKQSYVLLLYLPLSDVMFTILPSPKYKITRIVSI